MKHRDRSTDTISGIDAEARELMRIVALPELSGCLGMIGENVTNLRAWQAPEM